ncbi:helix-turn-helix domain-containing protein, partial [Candidatus Sumerlaeota bacterium]|nr:helix-turn-helix domain-containing protein [Candidatus Sumerlaeota bacterium]
MNTIKPYKERTPVEKETARRQVAARLAKGGSPAELARAYGVSRQTIYAWRDDAADPDVG